MNLWKKYPYATGALAAGAAIAITVGTGPIGWIVGLAAVGAAGSVSKAVRDKQVEKKDG